ncbi:MAG: VWA domain-containing protein [Pyrinomonadaceae bacterium]|nr:VWA domain-containing protein [Pyrinomonadaceae bacterium]
MRVLITILFTFLFALSVFAQTQAEITAPMTYLRKTPSPTAEKLETIQKGDKVTLENRENKDSWFYVSLTNGKKGWISENTFRALDSGVIVNESNKTGESKPKETEKPKEPVRFAIFGNKPKEVEKPKETPKTIVEKPKPEETPKEIERPRVAKVKENEKPKETPKPKETAKVKETPTSKEAAKVESNNQAPPTETVLTTPAATSSPTPKPDVPIEDKEVLNIDTEEVNLNVRVVDANNRSVNNLKQSQFQIYEDDVLQPITSFVTTEVPIINALVIDNSRSLRSQLTKVIEAGKILVSANKEKDVSTIFRFVSANKIELVQDFTSNKNSLNNALDNLFVEGGQTAIIDAVYQATQKVEQYQNSKKPEDVKVRALILVSDGDDRSSTKTEQELLQLLRAAHVQIYAIGFTNNLTTEPDATGVSCQEKAKTFLTKLSSETGGKVYFPNSVEELSAIAVEIAGDLRTQYLISYSPTGENSDKNFHQIKVVTESGDKAITRTGRSSTPQKKP